MISEGNHCSVDRPLEFTYPSACAVMLPIIVPAGAVQAPQPDYSRQTRL